ncbi:MAG: response regulator [Desulfomonilaceae bacterium]|nr:response regulator [Desulfomonilaceae bacterium]
MHSSILVVEDEVVVAMEIEEKLRAIGYDVVSICSSGEEAISGIEARRPDLVLMDIRLDGRLDGIETAELIRKNHDLPVVYLTAYADDATLNRAKLTEPFGYLVKPFSQTELRTTIEIALHKHVQDVKTKEMAQCLASTVNVLGAALIVADLEGNVKHLNHVAESLTGWSASEAITKQFSEVFVLQDPKTGKILENPVSMPLKMGFSSGAHVAVLKSKHETDVYIEHTVLPITDSEGRFSGIIIAFQEVWGDRPDWDGWFNLAANLYLTAALLSSDGEHAKAVSFYRRALLLFEKHLGSDDDRVLNVVRDLSALYKSMGRQDEVRKLETRFSALSDRADETEWESQDNQA